MDYTFPFDTCEKPSGGARLAQPLSSLLGLVSIGILLSFLPDANTEARSLICLFVLFEVVHTLSHVRHIPGNIQAILIHLIAYAILFSYILMFYSRYGVGSMWVMALVGVLVVIDVVMFATGMPFIYYFMTMSAAFLLVFLNYYPSIPTRLRPFILGIASSAVVIIHALERIKEF